MKEINTNVLNIVCSKYSVIGIKEAIHRLKDAIENSDGNVGNVLQNLGLDTSGFTSMPVRPRLWVLREVRKSFSFFVSLYFFPLIHILIKNNITEHSNICKIGKNCRSLGNM